MKRSHRILGMVLVGLMSGAGGVSAAEEVGEADHVDTPHEFVRIHQLSVRPEELRIDSGEAFGWLNYTNAIARVSFDKDVAKHLLCKTRGSFHFVGDRLESGDIQAQQFATLCTLAPGEYTYRVELREGAGGDGVVPTRSFEGRIVVK
jgi:plastocyanin